MTISLKEQFIFLYTYFNTRHPALSSLLIIIIIIDVNILQGIPPLRNIILKVEINLHFWKDQDKTSVSFCWEPNLIVSSVNRPRNHKSIKYVKSAVRIAQV
jgi:hypothetical protein